MTEEDARAWLTARFGGDALGRLAHYVALLIVAADQQNLISASTLPTIWARHVVDSAQLVTMGPPPSGNWIDVGSGAGLPGLVVALTSTWPVVLIEPRRLRVAFLNECVAALGLERQVTVIASKVEAASIAQPAAVISARAVAPLSRLIGSATHLADIHSIWLLPKGTRAESEVAEAKRSWQGMFHVEHSVVDSASGIVVASQVRRR